MVQLDKSKESFIEQKKVNLPKKGAGRKWAKHLEELGKQSPPEDLMKKINKVEDKKIASSNDKPQDLDN
ncbi:MAG: hypothetical protein JNL11_02480 [Bdellovibrionaceae bacterium]|nr:hypothetical protein [Pseudobdellovibrionaceae bacterium]